MDVCLLWVLCVVRKRSLRRADHSSRGVLPTVVCRFVWSRNLVNEEALARVGPQRHRKKNCNDKCRPHTEHTLLLLLYSVLVLRKAVTQSVSWPTRRISVPEHNLCQYKSRNSCHLSDCCQGRRLHHFFGFLVFYFRRYFQKCLQRLRGHNSDVCGYRQCGQHNSSCCLSKIALWPSRTHAAHRRHYFLLHLLPIPSSRFISFVMPQTRCFIFNTRSRPYITNHQPAARQIPQNKNK